MGRPSDFTGALLEEICDRLAKGEPLAVICRDEHMPCDRTVRNWMARKDDIGARVSSAIAHAREVGFDQIAVECLLIADDSEADFSEVEEGQEEQPHGGSLKRSRKENPESVQRAKLRIETRLKLLAKWDPKRYGDKQTTEHTGPDGGPIQYAALTRAERVARIQELEEKRRAADRG